MNLPNRLTVTRLVMAPIFFLAYFLVDIFPGFNPAAYAILLGLFYIVMELTDLFEAKGKRRSRDFANGLNAKHFWWRCARGKHPFPSRTRWLRPGRPMVLCWRRHGRAGGRQILRGYSSAGRAPALQAGGQGFESLYLHEGDEESARGRISGAWLREVYLPADTGTKDCEGIRRMPVTKHAKHVSPA